MRDIFGFVDALRTILNIEEQINPKELVECLPNLADPIDPIEEDLILASAYLREVQEIYSARRAAAADASGGTGIGGMTDKQIREQCELLKERFIALTSELAVRQIEQRGIVDLD